MWRRCYKVKNVGKNTSWILLSDRVKLQWYSEGCKQEIFTQIRFTAYKIKSLKVSLFQLNDLYMVALSQPSPAYIFYNSQLQSLKPAIAWTEKVLVCGSVRDEKLIHFIVLFHRDCRCFLLSSWLNWCAGCPLSNFVNNVAPLTHAYMMTPFFSRAIHLSNVAVQENYLNGKRSEKLPDNNFWSSTQFTEYLE